MSAINRRRRTVSRETGSFWLSFSDMMSVLVLVFIFVIFSMMLSLVKQKEQLAKTEDQYAAAMQRMEASEKELSEKETILATTEAQLKDLTEELNGKTLILQQKEQELSDQAELIRSQQEEIDRTVIVLNDEKQALDEQLTAAETKLKALENSEKELEDNRVLIIDLRKQLSDSESENTRLSQRIEMLKSNAEASQQEIDELLKAIEDKKAELDKLGVDYQTLVSESENAKKALSDAESRIDSQSAQLTEYEQQLDAYRDELQKKQGQLEQMVGVKAQIVQQLSSALRKSGIDVSVDEQTGAIALPSQMLFTTNSATLSNGGQKYLRRFLPVYLDVLLSDEFRSYVAEIIIEGHTDSNGTYLHNLQLSQERALSVANYVLGDSFMSDTLGLNASAKKTLLGLVTASGRSFSAPVLGANGDEDQNASRRVEIKFRLKDDETIAATEELLKLMGAN
ncbi:MAG: OmpA family protein [Clostridiales bacterium]|nr:OmpA family protein [Clostridiales bacterium]